MNTCPPVRRLRAAALLVVSLLASVASSLSHGAEPFRLDRIAIVRFTPTADGRMDMRNGVLDISENITWRGSQSLPFIEGIPDWALNRNLARVENWAAYYALGGSEVVANFEVQEGGIRVVINEQAFIAVGVSEFARVLTGDLINISTRARVAAGGDVVVAGFVVEGKPRALLIRAVGPGLDQFDLRGATPDPFFRVMRNGTTIHFNDNWWSGPDAELIERATASVGAFPLAPASRDAAKLVILGPGVYTVQVQTAAPDVPGGDVLVEVYSVPEDVFDAP